MKKQVRYACLGTVSLLGLGITGFSYARLNASTRKPQIVEQSADKLVSQGLQEDSIGNRHKAVALTNQAADILLTDIKDSDARARLTGCAIDLSMYGERRRAIALLSRIKGYDDPAGKQAATFYDQITHGDRAWQTAPVPDTATVNFRKEILKPRSRSGT